MRQEAMGWRERGTGQPGLELWSPEAHLRHMSERCPQGYCSDLRDISLFFFIIWFLFVVLSFIQPSLTLEKGSLAVEKVSRNSNPSKKRAKFLPHESELSDSDEYADFTSRTTEFSNTVGDETNSAVQSIQQVCSVRNDLLAFRPLKST